MPQREQHTHEIKLSITFDEKQTRRDAIHIVAVALAEQVGVATATARGRHQNSKGKVTGWTSTTAEAYYDDFRITTITEGDF